MSHSAFLPFRHELVVDNFAGGGGASTGIEWALGRPVDIAVNHSGEAIAMHEANHPHTRHLCGDVFDVEPLEVTGGQPVGLAWFSPDCTHFSKAKGGKPRSKKIRGLAWVVVRWAAQVKPRVIMLENVEEFADWGPLLEDGTPCPLRKGLTFRRWVRELESHGYRVEMRELRACDYGAPTTRKRLFVIARCDGRPIVWPKPTHGEGRGLLPYRTAAECIDWSIPCPSIFLSREEGRALGVRRPLAENTMRRIARGLWRFVLTADDPFTAPSGVAAPFWINTRNGERPGQEPRCRDLREPYLTITAQGSQGALISAFLAKHYGDKGQRPGSSLHEPVDTITARDHHALVTSDLAPLHATNAGRERHVRALLMKYYGTSVGQDLREPLHTVTSKGRFGLVTVEGELHRIIDVGMRMLKARELFLAQGFPASYVIDPVFRGKRLSETAQQKLAGNAVPPYFALALVKANFAHEARYEAVTA